MQQSGKLPVLNLLTGQESGFRPQGPTGTRIHLAVQNFTSIAAGGGNANEKFPLFGKVCAHDFV